MTPDVFFGFTSPKEKYGIQSDPPKISKPNRKVDSVIDFSRLSRDNKNEVLKILVKIIIKSQPQIVFTNKEIIIIW